MSDAARSVENPRAGLASAGAGRNDAGAPGGVARPEKLAESALDSISEGFVILDRESRFVFANPAAERFVQKSRADLLGLSVWEVFPEAATRRFGLEYRRAVAENVPVHFEEFYPEPLNAWYEVRAYPSPEGLSVFFLDISERKWAEGCREMGRDILQILNETGDSRASIQRVLAALKTRTGFDAVGIRLQDGDDFPYFAQEGFPEDFLLTENTLTERGADGGVCRDKDGSVSLECTCGLVISGKTDSANPLFTPGGSCWMNDSFPLLDIPPGEDPRRHPRNQCIHRGYASVALVPIRTEDRVVGLIQLNDRRHGCFTLERVELLEGIASHIGSALMRKQAEAALRESEERRRTILLTAMDGFWLVDLHGRLLEANEAYCRMSGYSAPELLAMRIPDLEAVETPEETAARIQTLMARGEERFESRHRRKDGSTFDVEVSVKYWSAGDGRFVVFLRDVSERKLAERRLERARDEALAKQRDLEDLGHALSESEAGLHLANQELEAANVTMRRNNELLEARVAQRTAALAQRTAQMQALALDLTRAEERERQRVAQILHDHLQQLLSVARMNVGMALDQVTASSLQKVLAATDDLIAESLDITRSLTAELRPAILHRSGLAAALQWLGRWYEERFGLKVAVDTEGDVELGEELRVTMFRGVRELLFNVVKHAKVASARVRLSQTPDGRAQIVVSDEGVGFDPEVLRAWDGTDARFGLFSVRERLDMLGGRLDVESAPGGGASFTIIGPAPRPAEPDAPDTAPVAPLQIAVRKRTGVRHGRPAPAAGAQEETLGTTRSPVE